MDNEKAVTQSIIRAIEKGTANFVMPWHRAQVPINALTKKPYRGINTLSLWATGVNEGFESSEWAVSAGVIPSAITPNVFDSTRRRWTPLYVEWLGSMLLGVQLGGNGHA
jgi:hypothetical protein